MRTSTYLWSTFAALLFCSLGSIVVAQDRHIFAVGGGRCGSLTNSRPVSHGHAYFVTGEPGFLFGGFQDGKGKWNLNYLVLIKHNAVATSTFEHRDPEPTVSSDSSDGKIRQLYFKERLRLDKATFGFSYKAQIDLANDVLGNEQMTVQGNPAQVTDGRVFIIDMTVEPVRYQQVNVKLPSSEKVDFLKSVDKQYQEFTKLWIAELAKESEVVAKTFTP